MDSVVTYLQKSAALRLFMNSSDVENYFKSYIAYYEALNNIEIKNNYEDSLKIFQQNMIKETVDASFNISETLLSTSEDLEVETEKTDLNRKWIIGLVSFLVVFITFVLLCYKNIRKKLKDFSKRKAEFSLFQNNHEKLKVKVKGLESYISDVQKEIKSISNISHLENQQHRIKELYKNIHHNSSTLLYKSEDHLELISELNIEFFNEISTKYPSLNSSEIIICYYLLMGFKSKEIAVFLNTSIRAVEGKRYRISKKMKLQEKHLSLVDFIDRTFKNDKENFIN